MKTIIHITMAACILAGCSMPGKQKATAGAPAFPAEYQALLDSSEKKGLPPLIGDDIYGFNPMSGKIRYLKPAEMPADGTLADTLVQIYNFIAAYNAIAYDCNLADRYIKNRDMAKACALALRSMDLSAVADSGIRKYTRKMAMDAAEDIIKGVKTAENGYPEAEKIHEVAALRYGELLTYAANDNWPDMSDIVEDYGDIHRSAVSDTVAYRYVLMERAARETDFARRCVYAREFAYANFQSTHSNYKDVITLTDPLLTDGRYSPLLADLWLIWRTTMQLNIMGNPADDGPIYNLFYNDMRNRVAETMIRHIMAHPDDRLATEKFIRLAEENNVLRPEKGRFKNTAFADALFIYDECMEMKN